MYVSYMYAFPTFIFSGWGKQDEKNLQKYLEVFLEHDSAEDSMTIAMENVAETSKTNKCSLYLQ